MSQYRLTEKPSGTSSRIRMLQNDGIYEAEREELKRQSVSLIAETSRTFRELTTTLNKEQTKLSELEDKRKRLLLEMMELKADIEKEKIACRRDLEAVSNGDVDNVDPWHGLNTDDMERRRRSLTRTSSILKTHDLELDADKRTSSVELANDIIQRLESIAKRNNNTQW